MNPNVYIHEWAKCPKKGKKYSIELHESNKLCGNYMLSERIQSTNLHQASCVCVNEM